jgi:predicted LPLAT superfamily acyltransferase
MFAFDDVVHGVTGKAAEGKILPRTRNMARVADAIGDGKSVLIKFNGDFEGLGNIVRTIETNKPEVNIAIVADKDHMNELKNQYKYVEIVDKYAPECYDRHMCMCEHIFKLTGEMPEDVYIDSWCNIVYTASDFVYARSFEETKELFKICRKEILVSQGGHTSDSTGDI